MNPDAPFDEPWQARVFALTQGAIEGGSVDREAFRQGLIRAIENDPARSYWESWLCALEAELEDAVTTLGDRRRPPLRA